MTFKDKIKTVLSNRYNTPTFKRHLGEFFCNKWWCNSIRVDTVYLSEIKSSLKSVHFEPFHHQIEYDILERGFDYSKGHIYVTSKNVIIDGHHRYFILKKHFDDSLLITVYRLMDVDNRYLYFLKLLFIHGILKIVKLFKKKEMGQLIELDV